MKKLSILLLSFLVASFANAAGVVDLADYDSETDGTLSATTTNNGTVISGEVETSVALSGSLAFDLTASTDVSLSGDGDLSGVDDLTIYLGALEDVDILDDLSLTGGYSTEVYFYEDILLGSSYYTFSDTGELSISDSAYVFTTTLSDLYYAGESDIKSAYTLSDASESGDNTITKYLISIDESGNLSYELHYYVLNISDSISNYGRILLVIMQEVLLLILLILMAVRFIIQQLATLII